MERLTGPSAAATIYAQRPENVYWSASGNLLSNNEVAFQSAYAHSKVL